MNYPTGYNLTFSLCGEQELEVGKYPTEAKQRKHNPAAAEENNAVLE
jgi:hypothetical protein